MTQKAIEVLGGADDSQPFILMVEGALIDKQSHPNHAAGTIWDVIELDKSVGVARAWASKRAAQDTLIVVTADHDQSMSIIGANVIEDADFTDHNTVVNVTVNQPVGEQKTTVLKDSYSNVRASYGFFNSGGDPNTTGIEGPFGLTYQNVSREAFPTIFTRMETVTLRTARWATRERCASQLASGPEITPDRLCQLPRKAL